MTLSPGTRLGPFEIVGLVGAGGMGEVYRATDTDLKRAVAVKVLPEAVATDRDRLARFQREAEVLAALNHPNIAAIYGLERSDRLTALVMELVDGPTLADRIAQGPVPIDEALPIAKQIAEAVEAAHEQGIVHRDLKPANIKLRPDGMVKVLDFGLAKLNDPHALNVQTGSNASNSPTITSPAMMTGIGVILGTAAYMSPEQAKGKPADKRSDIWAFGCVLYEMLCGRRPFGGDDVSDTLASILKTDPDWTALPARVPVPIRRLIRRCLAKDKTRRIGDLSIARLEIDESLTTSQTERAGPVAADTRLGGYRRWWPLLAGAIGGASAAAIVAWLLWPAPLSAPTARFTMPIPARTDFATTTDITDMVFAPDGRSLVLARTSVGLVRRWLDGSGFDPIRGAEDGIAPFFSPDGEWIGFRVGGKLKKVSANGGLAIDICDVSGNNVRAAWGPDGLIIVAEGGTLYQVPAAGGVRQQLLETGADGSFQPVFVPGTRVLIVRKGLPPGRLEAIDLATLTHRPLIEGSNPRLSPSGRLMFEQRGAIWSVGFDPDALALTESPTPVTQSVHSTIGAQALLTIAANGSFAYIEGNGDSNRSLVWLDRTGGVVPAIESQSEFASPRLSPDGRRVIVNDGVRLDLWSYEFDRGTRLRLTTSGSNRRSVWSPDGEQIAFYSTPPGGDQDLYVMPSTGGTPKQLLARPGPQYPDSWSPDGRFIIFEDGQGGLGATRDLWLLPIGGEPKPLVVTSFNERGAVLSPDGRWFAYVSNESGRAEVYIQPFPGPGPRTPISTNGGVQPMWARDGRELLYRQDDWLMSVPIALDPLKVEPARRLFELSAADYNLDPNFADYDVARDGRVLAIRSTAMPPQEIQVVLNWTPEVTATLPR